MPIAQPNVVGAGSLHSALSLGCPVVQSRDGHTRHVADFFGRKHLSAVGYGACHGGSLMLKGFVNMCARSAVSRHVVTVSRYSHPPVRKFRLRGHQPADLERAQAR